jgi:O-antigen ligase
MLCIAGRSALHATLRMPALLDGGIDVSKFNTSKALGPLDVSPSMPSEAGAAAVLAYGERLGSPTPIPNRSAQLVETRPNIFQRACFGALCIYLLSGFANEFASRLLHTKAYLSTVTLVLVPSLFLLTGSTLRGLRIPLGKWWIAFGLWLAICAPFSVWKSNTAELLLNFYFRSYLLYFVICACALTLGRIRALMYVLGFGNLLVVLSCFAYGSLEDGRFSVAGSSFSFLSNANELGLQLLMGVTALIFLFFHTGKLMKAVCIGVIAISSAYMLKTASRGVFIAALATMLALFLLSRHKVLVAAVTALLFLGVLVVLPSTALHRLTHVAIGGSTVVTNEVDESTLASQLQRERLFWDSVRLTFQNPIFGVGPGEFIVADSNEKEKKGERGTWRQTHNSYTQVSSEAGLPGLIFFVGSILSCFRLNYRVYRQTAGQESLQDYAGLSFCMLLGLVAFSTGAIFDQLAYTSHLAILSGITTATYLVLQPALREQTKTAKTN